MNSQTKVPQELRDLEQTVGSFIQFWGFEAIHGRIWVHLFLADGSLRIEHLAARLEVPSEEIGRALPQMVQFGVIEQKSGEESDHFAAHPDLSTVILNVMRKRELPMVREALRLCDALPSAFQGEGALSISSKQIQKLKDTAKTAETLLGAFVKFAELKQNIGFPFPFLKKATSKKASAP